MRSAGCDKVCISIKILGRYFDEFVRKGIDSLGTRDSIHIR